MTPRFSNQDGFTIAELLISTTILLIVTAGALTTFQNAVTVNDTAAQMSDANQNLRVGINQMIRDIMQAGRIIGPGGIPVPTGTGALPISRPAPPGQSLTFDLTTTTNLPDITTGYQLGPTIVGIPTDLITLITVDPFMAAIETPPAAATALVNEGTIDPLGAFVTLPATSNWIIGDVVNDTPAIQVGDLVLFKNPKGMAIQTVTRMDATTIYFDAGDWFNFNQRSTAPGFQGSVLQILGVPTSLFRVIMSTYYVDFDPMTASSVPRLVRQANNFPPQALAGVVEGLTITFDLVDGVNNPAGIASLPFTDTSTPPVIYSANQIRKVNLRIGVRSETMVPQSSDYVRNQIATSVDVRSLASVNRYVPDE